MRAVVCALVCVRACVCVCVCMYMTVCTHASAGGCVRVCAYDDHSLTQQKCLAVRLMTGPRSITKARGMNAFTRLPQ